MKKCPICGNEFEPGENEEWVSNKICDECLKCIKEELIDLGVVYDEDVYLEPDTPYLDWRYV